MRYLLQSVASSSAEVREAQRLRYRVFAEEMRADLDARGGLDCDEFDPYCDHLLVRDGEHGEVVGTYRILPGEHARRRGGFYSETEFDLGRIRRLPGLVELGRACVHPDYRHGGVIALLWSGLLEYIHERGYRHVIGCASVHVDDDGRAAAGIFDRLRRERLAPEACRVFPRRPFAMHHLPSAPVELPPLIKGYVRLGAYLCGDPAWDDRFRTADGLLMLEVARIDPRYARRLRRAA
jgi:putative hemolysin